MANRPGDSERGANCSWMLALRAAAALTLAMLCLMSVASCLLKVSPNDPTPIPMPNTPTPVSVAAPGGNWHDLAIISLDLDPPLKPGEVLAMDSAPVMLVAVDNKGNQTEKSVLVHLRITGPTETDVISTDKRTITSLGQGEAKVVRFDRVKALPPRSAYIIHVEVQAAPGEVSLADNIKEMRVQVVAGAEQ